MNKTCLILLALGTLLAAGICKPLSAATPQTISGYVIDSACTFTKDLHKPISRQCAIACAKAGSPLVILAASGKIYWPISDQTPAAGQNARLLKYAGQRVTVTGKVYAKGGSSAIVIQSITAAAGNK